MATDTETLSAIWNNLIATAAKKFPDTAKARRYVIDRLQKDRPLLEYVSTPMVSSALSASLGSSRGGDRFDLKRRATTIPASVGGKNNFQVIDVPLETIDYSGWYNYTVGNLSLADCRRPDLLTAASHLESRATGMMASADFHRAIAEKIGNDETCVRDTFSEAELAKLWKSVESKRKRNTSADLVEAA